MATDFKYHSDIVTKQWRQFSQSIQTKDKNKDRVVLTGLHLDLSDVLAVSRYGVGVRIDDSAYHALDASRDALEKNLSRGDVIYGVNTGFGGSADTRTKQTERLQQMLTRELSYGILPPGSRGHRAESLSASLANYSYDLTREISPDAQHIPWTWVRAAILIRLNSLINGYSAVRPVIVERLQDLLTHDILPMIPLRGSISASGDLNPLAYIAGAIQGKSGIQVLSKAIPGSAAYADAALQSAGLIPVTLKAKEGLAIVNGTAISTAAGALALHDAHNVAIISQLLTAMSVEALLGTTESFHPFFAKNRPHPGQIESARNILSFLSGSKLAQTNDGADGSLRQDRYSIRTASQWLGPALEDLVLAHQQIVIECNSVTDNPLITSDGTALHGGNFQAKAVTSAMEKTRAAMQSIGRMLFTQCVEMINPTTNRGLPPNLVAEDPSTSGLFKGTDIHIAALQAELGFLSAPVNHVQTAEMGNQSLNSLALISARYTHTAIAVLSELAAAHLIAVCQALDLRAMHIQFLASYRPTFSATLAEVFKAHPLPAATNPTNPPTQVSDIESLLWTHLLTAFSTTTSLDASARFPAIVKTLCSHFASHPIFRQLPQPFAAEDALTSALLPSLQDSWCAHRDAYLIRGDANANGGVLGKGTRRIYDFVRRELNVPLLCTEKILTPKFGDGDGDGEDGSGMANGVNGFAAADTGKAPTVGSYQSTVYRAIRDGTIVGVLMEVLEDVSNEEAVSTEVKPEAKQQQQQQQQQVNGHEAVPAPTAPATAVHPSADNEKAESKTQAAANQVAASETATEDVVASKVAAVGEATTTSIPGNL
ncbi:MAG: hypothetical protein Q9160_003650 [Pyrenula sp. 1 TL-2023]